MTYKKNIDNIAILSLETDSKKENSINQNFSKTLLKNVIRLEQEKELKGVIILFTKNSFLAKYDVDTLFKLDNPQTIYEYIESQKAILRRIEKLNVPVIAAISDSLNGLNLAFNTNTAAVISATPAVPASFNNNATNI